MLLKAFQKIASMFTKMKNFLKCLIDKYSSAKAFSYVDMLCDVLKFSDKVTRKDFQIHQQNVNPITDFKM